jgi:hypothetical protein
LTRCRTNRQAGSRFALLPNFTNAWLSFQLAFRSSLNLFIFLFRAVPLSPLWWTSLPWFSHLGHLSMPSLYRLPMPDRQRICRPTQMFLQIPHFYYRLNCRLRCQTHRCSFAKTHNTYSVQGFFFPHWTTSIRSGFFCHWWLLRLAHIGLL